MIKEGPPQIEKKAEKTHQQEAIEHQEQHVTRTPGGLKETPHDIIIGIDSSECRTCGEKWPKKIEKETDKLEEQKDN